MGFFFPPLLVQKKLGLFCTNCLSTHQFKISVPSWNKTSVSVVRRIWKAFPSLCVEISNLPLVQPPWRNKAVVNLSASSNTAFSRDMTQLFIQTMWKTHLKFSFLFQENPRNLWRCTGWWRTQKVCVCYLQYGELFLTCQFKNGFFKKPNCVSVIQSSLFLFLLSADITFESSNIYLYHKMPWTITYICKCLRAAFWRFSPPFSYPCSLFGSEMFPFQCVGFQ